MRPAVGSVVLGTPGYLAPSSVRQLLRDGLVRQSWWYAGEPRTVRLRTGELYKSWRGFGDPSAEEMEAIVDVLLTAGLRHPSSFSDVFQRRYRSPVLMPSVPGLLASGWRGGWEQARRVGVLAGHWRLYDLRSAYLWAVAESGLPDPRTFVYSERLQGQGVWLCDIQGDPSLPYPYQAAGRVLLSHEDLEHYGPALGGVRVLHGLRWSRWLPPEPLVQAVELPPYTKQLARTYWGRWVGTGSLECRTHDGSGRSERVWTLPNRLQNPVWAHLIVSRVKYRIWEADRGSAHVYVDSVLTRRVLPIGVERGSWRLVREYPTGVQVQTTGWYGPPHAPPDAAIGRQRAA